MRPRAWIVALSALALAASLALLRFGAFEARRLAPAELNAALYASERVELSIRLAPEAWSSLEAHPRRFVECEVEHFGVTYDARIRLKGHRSRRALSDKPAFKLELSEEGSPNSSRRLSLNNLVEDPTGLREVLAYRFMAALGLPVPRTAYASVRLNGIPKGLYLLVEPLDEAFLAERGSRSAEDLLYEGEYGCDIQSADVSGFDLDAGEDPGRATLASFAESAAGEARGLFDPAAGPLDLRAFLAYLAGSAIVGDFDGYRHGHNYYAHHRAADGKWQLLPWGLDRAFKKHLAIDDSQGLLARRCLRDPTCKLEYVRTLARAVATFESLNLPAAAAELAVRADAQGAVPSGASERGSTLEARSELVAFLRARPAEVRRQLACIDEAGRELDRDGDGYGCTDCNDDNSTVHPGATESCNGIDDDCSGVKDDSPDCACEVTSVESREYHLCALPMPWTQAEQFCARKGLALARIDSKRASKALYQKARRIDRQRWWIGYSDREREGEFHWRDGETGEFTYWSRNQPDNGSCNEDCAALKPGGKGRWQDTHCGQHRPFICGPAPEPLARTQPPARAGR